MKILLSNSCLVLPAVVKQQQEEISRNHIRTILICRLWTPGRGRWLSRYFNERGALPTPTSAAKKTTAERRINDGMKQTVKQSVSQSVKEGENFPDWWRRISTEHSASKVRAWRNSYACMRGKAVTKNDKILQADVSLKIHNGGIYSIWIRLCSSFTPRGKFSAW